MSSAFLPVVPGVLGFFSKLIYERRIFTQAQ
jgi:hypothetical protein